MMYKKLFYCLVLCALSSCSNMIDGSGDGSSGAGNGGQDGDSSGPYTIDKPFGFEPVYVERAYSSHFEGGTLVTVFPADVYGPYESGFNFESDLDSTLTKTISYEVKFAPDFDFVKGGKLPGLCGGEDASGGDPADGTNGFSARMMWRTDGRIVSYVYHVNQADDFGDDFQWRDSSGNSLYFDRDVWQKVRVEVTMNSLGKSDGSIRAYFNDSLAFEKTNFVFRTISSINIDELCFGTFFGGDSSDWAPEKDETLYIRNLIVE